MVSRLHPSRFCRSNTCALWAPRLPVASIAARLGFGRGMASPLRDTDGVGAAMPTPSSCGSTGLNSTPVGVMHRVTARHDLLRFDQEVSQCSRESVGML